MSRSLVACRCGEPLARKHHGGRLHPLEAVRGFYEPARRHGPFLGLTCPKCGERRDCTVMGPAVDPAAGICGEPTKE